MLLPENKAKTKNEEANTTQANQVNDKTQQHNPKGQQGTGGGGGHLYYLDCGPGFTGMCLSTDSASCAQQRGGLRLCVRHACTEHSHTQKVSIGPKEADSGVGLEQTFTLPSSTWPVGCPGLFIEVFNLLHGLNDSVI